MIEMCAQISSVKEELVGEDVMGYSIVIELFNLFRGVGFIVWYFYCNHLVKQRKVTVMEKLIKIFRPMIGVYFLLFFIEVVVAIVEI